MATYKSSNEQALWISALTNRTAINALMVDRAANRQSPFVMIDRIADIRFNIPSGKRSTSFQPVYNPQDKSEWPELLGWLITVGEMVEVKEEARGECSDCGCDVFEPLADYPELCACGHAKKQHLCPDCGGDCDSILKAAQESLAKKSVTWGDALDILVGRGIVLKLAAHRGKYSLWKDGKLYLGTALTKKQVISAAAALPATA